MNYKLSLGYWNSVFAVPTAVVDKYLQDATFTQIKVLLWMLRNSDKAWDSEKITKLFDIKEEEVEEAFRYWDKIGIFSNQGSRGDCDQNSKCHSSISEASFGSVETAPKRGLIRYRRPEFSHIISRIKDSKEIYYLIQEAQAVLGRPISSAESTILVMLHDNEGLPVDVILMLIQYTVSAGKGSIRNIEKMGIEWAVAGVDTVEKAEKKIQNLSRISMLWKKFEKLIDIERRAPSSQEKEIILKWFDEWKIEENLIKYAYDICIIYKGKYAINYMDGIIKRWHNQGISTLEQAKMFVSNKRLSNKRKHLSGEENSSYSIEEYESYSIFDEK